MNDIDESLNRAFKRKLSADELAAAHAAAKSGNGIDGRKLKRQQRNAVLTVRRKVNKHAERHHRH